MRAILVDQFGGADVLRVGEVRTPSPGRGEVLVRVDVAGVNFIDVYMRNGAYAKSHTYETPLPMTIGMEAAGTVAAVGEGVKDFAPGDRVAYCLARGSYAEFAVVPAWRLVKVPARRITQARRRSDAAGTDRPLPVPFGLSVEAGRRLPCACRRRRRRSAADAVGEGAGRDRLRHGGQSREGADRPRMRLRSRDPVSRQSNFGTRCMQLTNGRGVDVVYDSVGKDTIDRSIRSLRRRGLCIMYGASSGQVSGISPLALAEAGIRLFHAPASRRLHGQRGGNRRAGRRAVRSLSERISQGRAAGHAQTRGGCRGSPHPGVAGHAREAPATGSENAMSRKQ